MDQSEAFRSVITKIKELEKQLSFCDEAIKQCDQSILEAENKIEEHFAICMNALAARKETLLREVMQKASTQKMGIEIARGKLKESVEACKITTQGALLMYSINPLAAENICKEVKNTPTDVLQPVSGVAIDLPSSILENFKNHGKVEAPPRFSVANTVTTLAGSIKGNSNGKGSKSEFNFPLGICLNPQNDYLYICDRANNSIRELTMQGEVGTFIAGINNPYGICMNVKEQSFYVSTSVNNTIFKISSEGMRVFAGSGNQGYSDGLGKNALFSKPLGIAVDPQTGDIFVCDAGNHLIRKISPQEEVSTIAGSLERGFVDGKGNEAKFSLPTGLCFDYHSRSLLVCDFYNNKIRRVQLTGEVSTLCEIPKPVAIAITTNKTILVSSDANFIYKIKQTGQSYEVSLLAGSGKKTSLDGKPKECGFDRPWGIAVNETLHVCFVVDHEGHVIRKMSFVDSM